MNLHPGKITKFISHSAEETVLKGFEFAALLEHGDIVGLFGDLGSGKTQFVKGICDYFEVKDNVSSPTFIIVNEYSGKNIKINHFDLYRLKNISEFKEIGFDNYTAEKSICLIEWAELADSYLGGNIIKVNFEYGTNASDRIIIYNDL